MILFILVHESFSRTLHCDKIDTDVGSKDDPTILVVAEKPFIFEVGFLFQLLDILP